MQYEQECQINQVECLKNWNPKASDEIIASLTCSKTYSHSNKTNGEVGGRQGGRTGRRQKIGHLQKEKKKKHKNFADKCTKVKVEELGTIRVMEQQTLVSYLSWLFSKHLGKNVCVCVYVCVELHLFLQLCIYIEDNNFTLSSPNSNPITQDAFRFLPFLYL